MLEVLGSSGIPLKIRSVDDFEARWVMARKLVIMRQSPEAELLCRQPQERELLSLQRLDVLGQILHA